MYVVHIHVRIMYGLLVKSLLRYCVFLYFTGGETGEWLWKGRLGSGGFGEVSWKLKLHVATTTTLINAHCVCVHTCAWLYMVNISGL